MTPTNRQAKLLEHCAQHPKIITALVTRQVNSNSIALCVLVCLTKFLLVLSRHDFHIIALTRDSILFVHNLLFSGLDNMIELIKK